jgi:hypothetical protein
MYFPVSRQVPESELEREGKRQVGSLYHYSTDGKKINRVLFQNIIEYQRVCHWQAPIFWRSQSRGFGEC